MKKRYKVYEDDHKKVEEAVACCSSNPSSELKNELTKIKSQIDCISISDWKDSSAVSFKVNRDSASLKLGVVISSVANVFSKSEQIYDLLNQQLNSFKIIDANYQDILNREPKQSDYKKQVEENGVLVEKNDVSAFQNAHEKWKDAKNLIKAEGENCIDQIDEYLDLLDEINSLSITMSSTLPYVSSFVPEVYKPSNVVYEPIAPTTTLVESTVSPTIQPSNTPVVYTTEIPGDINQSGYTVTCYGPNGWHFNASKKASSVGVGTGQRAIHELWNSQGANYENGVAVINDNGVERVLVACTSKIGKVGDRLTYHLENGQVVHAIVADQKSSGDRNYTTYGHSNGSSINILELEVERETYLEKGNPTTEKWGLPWDSKSKIVKVDNCGPTVAKENGTYVCMLTK